MFDQSECVHPVDLLADARRAAELPVRCGARRIGRHAKRKIVVNLHLDMGFDLGGTLRVPAGTAEVFRPAHGYSLTGCSSRPMAWTICCQRLVCSASCLRPPG